MCKTSAVARTNVWRKQCQNAPTTLLIFCKFKDSLFYLIFKIQNNLKPRLVSDLVPSIDHEAPLPGCLIRDGENQTHPNHKTRGFPIMVTRIQLTMKLMKLRIQTLMVNKGNAWSQSSDY